MIDRDLAEQHLRLGLNQHSRGKTDTAQVHYLAAIALLLADQQGILQDPKPTPIPPAKCQRCKYPHTGPCPQWKE